MSDKKIFVISRQKCGTTSTGIFLRNHGIRCLSPDGRQNRLWGMMAQSGEYDGIFLNPLLSQYQAFEDDPWWMNQMPGQILKHFPDVQFILMQRNVDSWFDSLKHHFNEYGGFSSVHAMEYECAELYYDYLNKNRSIIRNEFAWRIEEKDRKHYCQVYEKRNAAIIDLFEESKKSSQLCVVDIEDSQKWKKIGSFLNLKVSDHYNIHANSNERRNAFKNTAASRFTRDIKWILKTYLK